MINVIYNHKGGCGKTTLAVHAGFYAMQTEIKLAVVDADPQLNASSWLSEHNWTGDEEYWRGTVVVTTTEDAVNSYDNVIIDAPPAINFIRNMNTEIDNLIIPVGGRLSVSGAIDAIHDVKDVLPKTRVILVQNMVNEHSKYGKQEIEEAHKIGAEIFSIRIPQHEVVRRAELLGRPAWEVPYGTRSSTTRNLEAFSKWLIEGCPDHGLLRR